MSAQIEQIVVQRGNNGAGVQAIAAPTMTDAIAAAGALTPAGGLLVGSGSVFVAAELREAWNLLHPAVFPADDWVHAAAGEPVLVPPTPLTTTGV